jgi:hypothetical protein
MVPSVILAGITDKKCKMHFSEQTTLKALMGLGLLIDSILLFIFKNSHGFIISSYGLETKINAVLCLVASMIYLSSPFLEKSATKAKWSTIFIFIALNAGMEITAHLIAPLFY